MAAPTRKVLEALARYGLLLKQDTRLPNVVTLVTGEFLRTSWWSHPGGRLIFTVLSELSDHRDVLFTKLLYGKVTLVHRRLWPAFLAVASAGEAWQLRGLSASARSLLTSVNKSTAPVHGIGKVVKELEVRLLVHTEEVHTQSGRHETALITWSAWSRRVRVKPLVSAGLGRQQLFDAATELGAAPGAIPW